MKKKRLSEKRKAQLSKINVKVFSNIVILGAKLGFETKDEWKTKTASIDYVWFIEPPTLFPYRKEKRIPIVGFEIETSDRSRKHLKGNILNLLELSPAIGVIIILKEGFENKKRFDGCIKAVRRYAEGLGSLNNILVWSETELEELKTKLKHIKKPKKSVNKSLDEFEKLLEEAKKDIL